VRKAVFIDVAHVPEAGLLERPPRAAIRLLDRGDARPCLRSGEDDLARELLQGLRPEAAAGRVLFADQQVDAGEPFARPDDLLPLGVVGDEVGLDQPDGPSVENDQLVLRRIESGERVFGVAEALVGIAPPAAHVLAGQPVAQERQVDATERLEGDHAVASRLRSDSSARSSRTPRMRQASA
jgi:hypothetical protein